MAKLKNKVVQNLTLTCYRFTVQPLSIHFESRKSDKLITGSSLFNKIFKIHEGWQLQLLMSASKIFHFPFLIIFKQIVQLWTCQYKHIFILSWVFVTDNIVNSEHEMSTAKSLCYMAPPAWSQNVSHEKWWKMSVRPILITTLQTMIFNRFCPY